MRERVLFGIASAGCVAAAGLHAAQANDGGSPALRHGVFVVINVVLALALTFARVRRSLVFLALYLALVAQQLVSHGGTLVDVWRADHAIDPASAVVLVALPALLVVLLWTRRRASDQG